MKVSRHGFLAQFSRCTLVLCRCASVPIFQQRSKDFCRICELDDFFCGEPRNLGGQIFDAALAAFLQQALALGGGTDVQAAGVVGVGGDGDEAAAGESGDDAAHGGRLDLFGGGEFFECFGAAENEDGKRRELRGADAGGGILLADAAKQMDGGGVQAVGDGECVRWKRIFRWLDFGHGI